jgi:hypothetical protein
MEGLPPGSGRPFLFSFKLRRSLGIIPRVGGECKAYGVITITIYSHEGLPSCGEA